MTSNEYKAHLKTLEKIGKFPDAGATLQLWEPKEGWEVGRSMALQKFWIGQRSCMQIGFDAPGVVGGKAFWHWPSGQTSVIDRLRDWLGW